jgi:hypothetical protein
VSKTTGSTSLPCRIGKKNSTRLSPDSRSEPSTRVSVVGTKTRVAVHSRLSLLRPRTCRPSNVSPELPTTRPQGPQLNRPDLQNAHPHRPIPRTAPRIHRPPLRSPSSSVKAKKKKSPKPIIHTRSRIRSPISQTTRIAIPPDPRRWRWSGWCWGTRRARRRSCCCC